MELNQYQTRAMRTCMPTSENFSYMMLNLVGEVGEFASKVAKAIRKGQIMIDDGDALMKLEGWLQEASSEHPNEDKYGEFIYETAQAKKAIFKEDLRKEAGDILWQLAGLCSVMGWSLEDIAQQNLDKLASRQQRGKIDGDGDNR